MDISSKQYEYALERIEDLLPLVTEDTPPDNPYAIELAIVSDVVESYEKKHYPISKPTVGELIRFALDEKGKSQKELAGELGISTSRMSDYITGKSEPSLRIARALCIALGITPSAILGL